ncbi:hypothetical protein NM208_g8078 [Fusarium decemcellulare]|uniref:Uncharacterized protein n=1 Tax=Fusarium decemcellulare TaxID=57161 RepID=A0ACC1S6Q7_9HYPO|nr:hypothetical protein NM208_g8078 [Fusarium decemcellulare]
MPEHVNFYTPDNSAFYSRLPYLDLDPADNCIHLLRIKPPTAPDLSKTEQIECDLLDNISLDSITGRYTALSYCAGSPHDTEIVLVNGIPFNAFANLGHALRQARHFWMESGDRDELLLWADQICINQNNSSERTHQVKFMADIYVVSHQVLVSLSTEHDPEGGLGWLQGKVLKLESWRAEDNRIPFCASGPNVSHPVGSNAFLRTVLSSSWWTRAWIRQKFICSPDAYFMATFESIHWKSLEISMRLLGQNDFSRYMNEGYSFQLKQKGLTLQDVTSRVISLFLAKEERKLGQKWEWVRDLRYNLLQTYLCKASDPRDLVYAFLGISDRCYGIYPDYSPQMSFQKVCTQLAHNIIRHDKNLDILQWANLSHRSPQDPDWPSWVPDWRKQVDSPALMAQRNGTHHAANFSFSYYGNCNQKRILEVRGTLHTLVCHDPVPDHRVGKKVILSVTSEDMSVKGRVKKDDEVTYKAKVYDEKEEDGQEPALLPTRRTLMTLLRLLREACHGAVPSNTQPLSTTHHESERPAEALHREPGTILPGETSHYGTGRTEETLAQQPGAKVPGEQRYV